MIFDLSLIASFRLMSALHNWDFELTITVLLILGLFFYLCVHGVFKTCVDKLELRIHHQLLKWLRLLPRWTYQPRQIVAKNLLHKYF